MHKEESDMKRYLVVGWVVTAVGVGLVLGLMGCGGGGEFAPGGAILGVVTTGGQITPAGEATPPYLEVNLPGDETVQLDEANVGVSNVDLVTTEEDLQPEGEGTVELAGPYVADVVSQRLLNPDGTKALDITASFPSGTVLEKAALDITALAGVGPDPAGTTSIHLHGTYRNSSGEVVYNFHLDAAVQLEMEFDDDPNGGIVADGEDLLCLMFSVDRWFDGVYLSTANPYLVDGNGDVLFDDTNNTWLRDAIVANLVSRLDFAEDNDGDGVPEDTF